MLSRPAIVEGVESQWTSLIQWLEIDHRCLMGEISGSLEKHGKNFVCCCCYYCCQCYQQGFSMFPRHAILYQLISNWSLVQIYKFNFVTFWFNFIFNKQYACWDFSFYCFFYFSIVLCFCHYCSVFPHYLVTYNAFSSPIKLFLFCLVDASVRLL